MNPLPEPLLPTAARALRLKPDLAGLFDAISRVQRLYVHSRNPGAELASIQPLRNAVIDEEQQLILFPECGLSLDTGRLAGIHAVHLDKLAKPAPGIDFDFHGAARGLSLVALDEPGGDDDAFAAAIRGFAASTVPTDHLATWRADLESFPCMCPGCREAADRRIELASGHPLTRILKDAMASRQPLLCRLPSAHAGMLSWVMPGRVAIAPGGVIEAIDIGGMGLLQIKLELAHSLWVLPQRIDGEAFSVLRVHDMLGQLTLELAAPDPAMEARWRAACESSAVFRPDFPG